ncbi:hypothetical protein M422DRAFT_38172 [Sphaerobolus stellatus SS14]|uniref:F-box domain-containing protein n=1 Tax=Sphaerobolus stellatus (strain SS14) TaxID=990650 RepID=A0A0C9UBQ4_SPHS4|nr:hypothetical protein M422DRAFT_38172 [Sphaerobolus stellatus SS14]
MMEVDERTPAEPPKIPIETWQCIFQYLTRVGDLYNVSLTSRYMYEAVQPILYQQLCLDPNFYAIYTLSLLRRKPNLCHRVMHLTLLHATERPITEDTCNEAIYVYEDLGLPMVPCPPGFTHASFLWSPLGLQGNPQRSSIVGPELCHRPMFSFIRRFTNLTTLQILDDVIPPDFFAAISSLLQLKKLVLKDLVISPELRAFIGQSLPLQELTMIRCINKPYVADSNAAGHLCESLIRNSPNLKILVMDSFVERVAFNLLSDLEFPPPIEVFVSNGMSQQDPDTAVLRSVLNNLPTVTTLSMTRIPRELGTLLPRGALPKLASIKGQIKSIGIFFNSERPIEEVTITDTPASAGGVSWDTQLIQFFELINAYGVVLRSLSFSVGQWSEEVFLCICKLFPKLKVLKIQCNTGNVDQVCVNYL